MIDNKKLCELERKLVKHIEIIRDLEIEMKKEEIVREEMEEKIKKLEENKPRLLRNVKRILIERKITEQDNGN
jgi:hypothetical protein